MVVFGAGPIGCIHTRIARGVHGAARVFLVDVNAERLAMSAAAVHPDAVIDASQVDVVAEVMRLTDGRGADVVITATAANITQEQAIAMAARNGRISFFGGLPKTNPTITCDSNLVHYRQLHIHGANGSAPEHNRKALAYIASGQVPVKDLITVRLPLERALGGLRHRGQGAGHQGHRRALSRIPTSGRPIRAAASSFRGALGSVAEGLGPGPGIRGRAHRDRGDLRWPGHRTAR